MKKLKTPILILVVMFAILILTGCKNLESNERMVFAEKQSANFLEKVEGCNSFSEASKAPCDINANACYPCDNSHEACDKTVDLPVLMYHSILKSVKNKYTLSPEVLEGDIIYLKERGYQSITASQLIDFVDGKCELPAKPVLITFDDGHYNNYHYAMQVLKKHNFTAIISPIGKHSEYSTTSGDHSKPNYSHLTWTQLKEMAQSKVFELGNHTYNMHNSSGRYGVSKLKAETVSQYEEAISADIARLQDKFSKQCGVNSVVFAYPYGKLSKYAPKVLNEMGFKVLLTCTQGVNKIAVGDYGVLNSIKRYNRSGLISREEFFSKVLNNELLAD